MKKIPFYCPDVGEEELAEIKLALDLSAEERSEILEDEFKRYVSVSNAMATSSGTSALHLCLCAIDIKRGDKVICSVNAHPSVPEVVRHFDAEPLFVDISPDDFNMDLGQLEKLLSENNSKKLRGVILNHMCGQPTDLQRVYEIAKRFNILVIEDASYALGGTFNGEKIGSLHADATVFSFQPEIYGYIANGGMLVTENDELAQRARLLRFHAMVYGGWENYENLDYVYDVLDIGLKYDISQIDAAFCLSQMKKNDKIIKRRQEIAAIYNRELKGVPHIELPQQLRDHAYSLYIIKVDKNRDHFAKELREKGVETSLHFIPLHLLSYYKNKYHLKVNDFPNALRNYQQILSLPIHPKMTTDEVMFVCEQVKDACGHRV